MSAHSFEIFGEQKGVTLVYSAPARSRETKETSRTILSHKAHLDQMIGRPWIWIIDFAQMEHRHYTSVGLARKLIAIINNEHSANLVAIYLVNPNFWLRGTISVLKHLVSKNLYPKIRLCEGQDAGLLLELGAAGLEYGWLVWLGERFKERYALT